MPRARILQRLEGILAVDRLRSDHDVVRIIEERLPTRALDTLRKAGLSDDEIFQLVLPRRTLSHRVARRERLSVDESDRVVRILRVITFGERVLRDREAFWRWFRSPKRQFDGRPPLTMLTTDAGARLVEEELGAIDHGFVA